MAPAFVIFTLDNISFASFRGQNNSHSLGSQGACYVIVIAGYELCNLKRSNPVTQPHVPPRNYEDGVFGGLEELSKYTYNPCNHYHNPSNCGF